jgi:hypothetical protein
VKKIFFILHVLLIASFAEAQTGIGTATPNASAKLDVYATDKGFLPPRVVLTASNSASPITSPANGLMVFNTVTAGTSPNQVVPGYYYWDATGLKWVSLSTTVGNVQNQAIYRSTSNTTAGSAVSTWNSRFNNIASGDLTVTSNTSFALSNGIYKIQWGLPHQQNQTYNAMQLQEFTSGAWSAWLSDANIATVANGGNTDWGGTTFMTDIIDCSSNTRTLRLLNSDGSRTLYNGASFVITKLNQAITTSTTADNLGNHTATTNILLNGNYISNDGGNEGIRIDNSGNVGIGTTAPSSALTVGSATGSIGGEITINPQSTTNEGGQIAFKRSLSGGTVDWTLDHYGTSNSDARFRIFGGSSETNGITIKENGNVGVGTASPINKLHVQTSEANSVYIESTTSDNNGMMVLNANTNQNWSNNWHEFIYFRNQGNNIGGILGSNGGNMVSYSTSSDYRLKTDLKAYSGIDLVNKIKTYDFAWKRDSSRMFGVMAHELQAILPYAVSGQKDAVDVNGKMIIQSVDYGKLTPILVKAIQELDIKIKEQEGKILILNKQKDSIEKRVSDLELLIKKLIEKNN